MTILDGLIITFIVAFYLGYRLKKHFEELR